MPLTWSSTPCKRHPFLAVAVGMLVMAVSLAVKVHYGVWWGALALSLLTLSVFSYYGPTQYELNAEGVVAQGLLVSYRRAWPEIQTYYADADGVLLSPLPKPSRLAATRGLYVRFADNRDEVLTRVEAFLEQAAGEPRAAASGDRTD
jgi:hypothetical protein